jgi:hypothetical protein
MELAVFAPGTTEAGANEHFKLLGSPVQASATALLNEPPCGVTFTVEVPELPESTVIVVGLTLSVKL